MNLSDLARYLSRFQQALDQRYAPRWVEAEGYIDSVTRSQDKRIVTGATVSVEGLGSQQLRISAGTPLAVGDRVLVRRLGGAIGSTWELVQVLSSQLDYGTEIDTGAGGPATPNNWTLSSVVHLDGDPTTTEEGKIIVSLVVRNNNPELSYVQYVVQYREASATNWNQFQTQTYSVDDTASITIQPVTSGKTYQVRLAAMDLRGITSGYSDVKSITVQTDSLPHGIQSISAQKVDGFMRITWTTSRRQDIGGYAIYSATDSNGTGQQFVASVPQPATTNSVTMTYDAVDLSKWYAIRLINQVGQPISVFTSWVKDTSPPPAPASITVEQREAGALISWQRAAFGQRMNLDTYRVYRATAQSLGATTASLVTSANSIVFPGNLGSVLNSNGQETAVYFAVTAVDKQGVESSPIWGSDTAPPPVPTNLFTVVQHGGLTLRWDDVKDPGLKEYRVYMSGRVDGGNPTLIGTTRAPFFSINFPSVEDRFFSVSSVDWAGNESAKATWVDCNPDFRPAPGDNIIQNPEFLMGSAGYFQPNDTVSPTEFWPAWTIYNSSVTNRFVGSGIFIEDDGSGHRYPKMQGNLLHFIPGDQLIKNATYSFAAEVTRITEILAANPVLEVRAYDPDGTRLATSSASTANLDATANAAILYTTLAIPNGTDVICIYIHDAYNNFGFFFTRKIWARIGPSPGSFSQHNNIPYVGADGINLLPFDGWFRDANPISKWSTVSGSGTISFVNSDLPPDPSMPSDAKAMLVQSSSDPLILRSVDTVNRQRSYITGNNQSVNHTPLFACLSMWAKVMGANAGPRTLEGKFIVEILPDLSGTSQVANNFNLSSGQWTPIQVMLIYWPQVKIQLKFFTGADCLVTGLRFENGSMIRR